MTTTKVSTISADGVDVFYREAGSPTNPADLLLHGFPSSSHQFRHLITILAEKYHVLAPDLPGFGFTVVPSSRNYKYAFSSFATTIGSFLDGLSIKKFAVYIFDYGAPTALRLALQRPEAITAIISQNGNAYVEGLGPDFWAPLQKYWASGDKADREPLRGGALSFEATKWQYENGSPNPGAIEPESYHLDYALLSRPGIQDIQLDIFYDYRTNVDLYPQFQEYFRKSQVPLLAIWGEKDVIFVPEGARAFKRDLPNADVRFVQGGHFSLETHLGEISEAIVGFLGKHL
jgi:pimeloyl-ACP methyl ester carboxylesterase